MHTTFTEQILFNEESRLLRFLLSNTYTEEGKEILKGLRLPLTHKEFFKGIYVEPFFIRQENEEVSTVTTPEDKIPDDYNFKSNDATIRSGSFFKEWSNFREVFFNLNEHPLLFIRGNSGTGKSTFLYYLITLLSEDENIKHTQVTLERYRSQSRYYDIELPLSCDGAVSRFIDMLFNQLKDLIENILSRTEDTTNNNLFGTYEEYFLTRYDENPIIIEFFEFFNLKKIDVRDCNNGGPAGNRSNKTNIMRTLIKLIESDNSQPKTISNLLICICELLFCLDNNKFNLLTFDGIEYLIDRNLHIYDPDVNKIISAFLDAEEKLKERFEKINFASRFKLILAARNTTYGYCFDRVQERIMDGKASVDVTEWYRNCDIYKSKVGYFATHIGNFQSNLKKITDEVIKDKCSLRDRRATGIMDMLERMYNFDKRSLQSNLLYSIAQIILGDKNNTISEKFIKFFNEKGDMVYSSDKGYCYRYLCRRAILRIILNRVVSETKGTLFRDLYISEVAGERKKSTFVRKMLIYMMHRLVKNYRITDDYVNLNDLVNAIARPKPQAKVDDISLKHIAKLVYTLGDFCLHDSAWQQLITIKFISSNGSTMSDIDVFVEEFIKAYNENGSNENYGVKINYAGTFLAYIQSDYEYFACRCHDINNNVPLIFSNDVGYIKSLIKAVYKKAIACIKFVISDERDIFDSYRSMYNERAEYLFNDYIDNNRLISHPKRILDNHICYLEHYKHFVKTVQGVFKENNNEILLKYVDSYIKKYKEIHDDLVDGEGRVGGSLEGFNVKDYNGNAYLFGEKKLLTNTILTGKGT